MDFKREKNRIKSFYVPGARWIYKSSSQNAGDDADVEDAPPAAAAAAAADGNDLSPESMAKAGFYRCYGGDIDTVRCAFCKIEIFCWFACDKPLDDHRRWSPSCPYLSSLSSMSTAEGIGNVPADKDPDPAAGDEDFIKFMRPVDIINISDDDEVNSESELMNLNTAADVATASNKDINNNPINNNKSKKRKTSQVSFDDADDNADDDKGDVDDAESDCDSDDAADEYDLRYNEAIKKIVRELQESCFADGNQCTCLCTTAGESTYETDDNSRCIRCIECKSVDSDTSSQASSSSSSSNDAGSYGICSWTTSTDVEDDADADDPDEWSIVSNASGTLAPNNTPLTDYYEEEDAERDDDIKEVTEKNVQYELMDTNK